MFFRGRWHRYGENKNWVVPARVKKYLQSTDIKGFLLAQVIVPVVVKKHLQSADNKGFLLAQTKGDDNLG